MRHMSITPLRAIERNGLKGFGFTVSFHDFQSSNPSPSPGAKTTADFTADEASANPVPVLCSSQDAGTGTNSGEAR